MVFSFAQEVRVYFIWYALILMGRRKSWRVLEQQIGFLLKWLNHFLFSLAESFPLSCKLNGFEKKSREIKEASVEFW